MNEPTPYSRDMADLTITGEISKVDEDKRQVFGWASVTEIDGEPVVDLQNDFLDTYELEKAAYDYVLHSRVGGAMHERMKKSAPKQVGTLIESFVITPEKVEKMGLPPETPRGWWIGFKVDDEDVWSDVKKKKFTGFSIHGVGKRQPVEKNVMTRTKQEYDGWLKRMSHIVGTDPDSIDLHLKQWMESEGKSNPSDDDIHNFLMTAYKDGDPHGEVTKTIAKHLIGRHDQKDHDPTKNQDVSERVRDGNFSRFPGDATRRAEHSRDEHKGLFRRGPTMGQRHNQWLKSGKPAEHAIEQGRLKEGQTGDPISDAQKAKGWSDAEFFGQMADWADSKGMSDEGIGSSETAQFMQDMGIWPDTTEMDRERIAEAKRNREKSEGLVSESRTERRRLAEEADQLLGKSMSPDDTKKLFLLSKVAEHSKSEEEAVSNVESISKALAEAGQEELSDYFSDVHKHLIGRHEQEDHDPTKKGKGKKRHTRKEHITASGLSEKGYKRRRNIGWLAGGMGAGAATGQGLFRQNQPLGEAYAGHWARGVGFMPGFVGPAGPLAGGVLTRSVGFTPGQKRGRKRRGLSKAFSEREREVLSKYLGKDFL